MAAQRAPDQLWLLCWGALLQEKASSVAVPSHDPEAEEKRRREAEEARLAELRAHGHPVTPEAFAEWRAKFDAEQALERSKLVEGKAEDKQNRPTGKQWFRQQEEQHLEVGPPAAAAPCTATKLGGSLHAGRWLWLTACPCCAWPQVEEPELEPDEEDGEDAREHWGSSGEEEDDLDYGDESDEDEEELLDELLASKGS